MTGRRYAQAYYTVTNIDQYQCHLIELFLQHFLIIYHKNYSHSRVPAATVTMATSALVQTNVFISPDVWPPNSPDLNPVDYRISGYLQDPCLSEAHTRHQRAETAPGWCMVRLCTDSHWRGHRLVEKAASGLCPYERTPFQTCLVNLSFYC